MGATAHPSTADTGVNKQVCHIISYLFPSLNLSGLQQSVKLHEHSSLNEEDPPWIMQGDSWPTRNICTAGLHRDSQEVDSAGYTKLMSIMQDELNGALLFSLSQLATLLARLNFRASPKLYERQLSGPMLREPHAVTAMALAQYNPRCPYPQNEPVSC